MQPLNQAADSVLQSPPPCNCLIARLDSVQVIEYVHDRDFQAWVNPSSIARATRRDTVPKSSCSLFMSGFVGKRTGNSNIQLLGTPGSS